MNAYMNQYQSNSVQGASQEQILLMLYDGAIRFTRQAQDAIERRNVEEKITYTDKAVAIVTEFRNTLDHSVGGEIAADLDRLYDFILREMIRAKVHSEAEALVPVLRILTDLRETWAEAIEIARREQTAGKSATSGDADSATVGGVAI